MNQPSPAPPFYLRLAAALGALMILAVGATRALWHLHDLSGMHHIGGIWMALAQSLNRGVFYPPLEENGYYAGTRYMPLLFGLIAGVERMLGDYLLATKLLTFLALLALVLATYRVVLRVSGRRLDALALSGLVICFPEGLTALLSPHADALAVALAVWGLFVLRAETPRMKQTLFAAVLFALAFGTKFSAVAAPMAAVLFLFSRQRKASVTLALSYGLLVLASLALVYFASQGRIVENFQALGSGGMSFATFRLGPARLIGALTISSRITFVAPLVLILALWTIWQNFRQGGFTLWDWYFLLTFATTLFIFTSPGTDANHLLELEIAAVLVVAQRLRAPAEAPPAVPASGPLVRIILLLALVIGGYGLVQNTPEEGITWPTLAEQLPTEPHLLTEDATPVVLLGKRPVVMDAFAFRVLAERKRIDEQLLISRISRKEFNALVMLGRFDHPGESLCPDFHFGKNVTDALRQSYRFKQQVGQYYLYEPILDDLPDE